MHPGPARRLTAIWDIQNGRLLKRVEGRHWAQGVVTEVALLAHTMTARGLSQAAPSRDEMLSFVAETAAETAESWGSMHQDVTNRRRTEVEQLNGWVVEKARAFGLPCEHNDWLARRVRELA